ncbi:MAG: DUF4430 domain-containing protein [Clostridia bacterium]|nr:DUF4430 domain-containing protein [Clostridia bacterium]
MKKNLKLISLILCFVLVAAMALFTTGCATEKASVDTTASQSIDGKTFGEGAKSFTFEVVDTEGNSQKATIKTDAQTVGDALVENGLVEGEESSFGLYVKTVNGITLDYDKDHKYWAFYVDGEYAMTGVDGTDITEGSVYKLAAEE